LAVGLIAAGKFPLQITQKHPALGASRLIFNVNSACQAKREIQVDEIFCDDVHVYNQFRREVIWVE